MNTEATEANEIEQSQMPLLDHLIELRQRLIYALVGIVIAFGICFAFSDQIYKVLVWPYKFAAQSAGIPPGEIKIIVTAPHELFFVYLKVAFFGALFCAFPLIATQLYKFVAPGLYKNERQAFLPFLIATPILFILGAMLVYFIVMPLALNFFFGLAQAAGDGSLKIEMLPKANEYLSFIMTLIMAFGICFQMPVLLTLLGKVGLASSQGLRQKRKYAIIGVFALAAILTPPDIITQIGLALPTLLLYEISIYLVQAIEKKQAEEDAKRAAKL